MPGALTRLKRAPAVMASGGLLVLACLAVAGVQGAAAAALAQHVDPDWRGAYDILVTPGKTRVPALVAPDSLGGKRQLSLAQLDRIRAIDGVEVAAPIANIVIVPAYSENQVQLAADVDLDAHERDFRDYRLTGTLSSDDGLGERATAMNVWRLELDQSNAPRTVPVDTSDWQQGACRIAEVAVDCGELPTEWDRQAASLTDEGYQSSSYWSARYDGDTILIQLPVPVQRPTRVSLVDPVAERALLGDAGAFLDPLIDLGSGRAHSIEAIARATPASSPYAGQVRNTADLLAEQKKQFLASEPYQEYLAAKFAEGQPPQSYEQLNPPPQYLGLLMTPHPQASVRFQLDVEALGAGVDPNVGQDIVYAPPILDPNVTGSPLGRLETDVTGLGGGFVADTATLHWFGSTRDPSTTTPYYSFGSAITGYTRALPAQPVATEDGYRLESTGFMPVIAEGRWSQDASQWRTLDTGASLGSRSLYSTLDARPINPGPTPWGTVFLPIDAVGRAELTAATDAAAGAPLGSYATAATTARASDGTTATVLPDGGLSFAATTDAIADLGGFAQLTDHDRAIDAVRVRVSGIDRYDADGIARVVTVAQAIRHAGFSATLVAGSTPEQLDLAVHDYAFGSADAGAEQRIGTLRAEQTWTRLGPAAGLPFAVSPTTLLLAASAILGALACYAGVALGSLAADRRAATVLRGAGWSRAGIVRWSTAPHLPVLAATVLAAAIAVLVAPDRTVTVQAVGFAVAGVAGIALARGVLVARPPASRVAHGLRQDAPEVRQLDADGDVIRTPAEPAHHPRARPARSGAGSPGGLGARLALAHGWWTAGRVVALLVVMVAVAAATALEAATALSIAMIALVAVLAGLGLGIATRLAERSRRAREHAALRAAGFAAAELARVDRAELLASGLPAVLLGSYLIWFGLDALGVAAPQTAVSAALVAGALALASQFIPLPVPIRKAAA